MSSARSKSIGVSPAASTVCGVGEVRASRVGTMATGGKPGGRTRARRAVLDAAVQALEGRLLFSAPTLVMSGNPSVNEGANYTLNLAASDLGGSTVSNWAINWGDGSAVQPVAGGATSANHVYADGTRAFTILATAVDDGAIYTVRAAGSNAQASLDPSFGNGGEVTQNFDGFTGDYVHALTVVQADGKVLVAGHTEGGTTRVALARYNADGTPDTTFGTGGSVVTEFGTYAVAETLLLDAAGNVLVGGSFGLARYAPNGVLDASFGNGGRITSFSNIRKAVRDAGGNILVGDGSRLARFLPNGAFDLSFGQNGIAFANAFSDFTLDASGRIVTIESRYNGNQPNQYDIFVRRFLANGQADAAFGQSGVYQYDSGSADYGWQVAVQNGQILVGGYTAELQAVPNNPGSLQTQTQSILLFRLTDNGQGLDTSFGAAGKVVYRYNAAFGNNYDYNSGMGVDPAGRIVVQGNYGVYRFSAAGQFDTGFGNAGVAPRTVNSYNPNSTSIAFNGSSIYIGGYAYNSGTEGANFAVQRLLGNGTIDNSFAGDGQVQTSFTGPLADYLQHVAVQQPDGKVLVVGYTSGGTNEILMARYLPNGQLDASFGTGGISRTGINGAANGAAVAADGTIFVSDGNYIYRFRPNGSRDTGTGVAAGFGSTGQRYAEGVYVRSLKIDSAGRLLVGGYRSQSTNGFGSADFAVARFSATGVLDTGYGGGGIASFDLNTSSTTQGDQIMQAMELDGTGRAVAVGYSQEYTRSTGQYTYKALIARFTTSGQLDASFNTSGGGALLTTGSDGSNFPQVVTVDSQGKVLVGFSSALHRYNSDGSLDTSFSGDGMVSTGNAIQALRLDGLGRVVTGGSGNLARFNTDGTPDTTFGPAGRIFTSGRNVSSIAIDAANRVMAAGYINTAGPSGTDYWLARYITDGLALTVNNVAPQGLAITGPTSLNEGSSVSLVASATDPAGANDPLTYSWNITRNGSSYLQMSGANITFAVPDGGSYVATVTVDDGDGGTAARNQSIAVANVAPIATLSGNQTIDEGGLATVAFTGASDVSSVDAAAGFHYSYALSQAGLATTYAAAADGTSRAFTFADSGTDVVYGRVFDKDGGSTTYSTTVTVNNVAPTPSILAIGTVRQEGAAIAVTGTASDPGGANDNPVLTWEVYKNGSAIPFEAGFGPSWSFTPDDDGSYRIVLTATDKDGGSAAAEQTISVANTAPTASVANDGLVNEAGAVTVSLTGGADASTADTAAGLRYFFSSDRAARDAATYADATITDARQFAFDDDGAYTVYARILDKDGGCTDYQTVVTVANVAPTAQLGNVGPADEGSAVSVAFAATSDPSSADAAAGLRFSFASTEADLAAGYGAASSSASQSFTFSDDGTYTVYGRVFDKDGGASTYSTTVTVNNVAPAPSITAIGSLRQEGTAIAVTGAATDPAGANDALAYAWAVYKDGLPTAVDTGQGAAWSFTPTDDGSYRIVLTVSDEDGGSASSDQTISVANLAPAPAIASISTPRLEGTTIHVSGVATDPGANDDVQLGWAVYKDGASSPFATGAGSDFDFTPDDNGSYRVALTTTDKDLASTTVSSTLAVTNVAPTASISSVAPVRQEGTAISVVGSAADAGANDGVQLTWTVFKDGAATAYASGAGQTFDFTPNDDGSYRIQLVGTDKDGGAATTSETITVANVAPAPSIVTVGSIRREGTAIAVTGSATDPAGANDTLTYAWAVYKDDAATPLDTGSDAAWSFTPADDGTYKIVLTVGDEDGGHTSVDQVVYVANVAPTASIDNTGPVSEAGAVKVSLTGGADVSGVDVSAGLRYFFSTDPAARDAATYAGAATASSRAFTFDDNGAYTVYARVLDKDGAYTDYQAVVAVINAAPTAQLGNVGPVDEGSPVSVAFTGTSDASAADAAAGFRYSYALSAEGLASTYGAATTAATREFTFDDNGTYTVYGRVFDKDGGATAYTTTVTVKNVAPTPSIMAIGSVRQEGAAIAVAGGASDPGAGDDVQLTWAVYKDGAHSAFATGTGNSWSFTPVDNGRYEIRLTATDKDGAATTASSTIEVVNVAPAAAIIGAPVSSTEGSAIVLGGGHGDAGVADTHTYAWTVLKDGAAYASGTGDSIAFTPDDNGVYQVAFAVTDNDGGVGPDSAIIRVANASPTPTIHGAPTDSPEGAKIPLTASVADPGSADTFTYAWSVTKDGAAFATAGGRAFDLTPDDNGTYVVTLTVTDDDGATGTESRTIHVTNVAPTDVRVALDKTVVNEGDAVTLSGSFTDPGSGDAHTVTIVWADGSRQTLDLAKGVNSFSAKRVLLDDAPTGTSSDVMPIRVTVADKDGDSASNGVDLTVRNVAPTAQITIPFNGEIYAAGTAPRLSATYADIGTLDTHRFTWTLTSVTGGTLTVAGTRDANGNVVIADPAFAPKTAGVYHIALTVVDDDGGSVSVNTVAGDDAYLVVYDAGAGFVTGGGWVNVSVGSSTLYPTLAGKVSFGFVSKYQNGASDPTGNTEFQFKAGDLNFQSTDYEWLVVSGNVAQYQGSGTINGRGDYGFIVTAIDGGQAGPDRFRIQIWDKSTGRVVFDNQMGKRDDGTDATVLGGGSIVIHT